VGGATDPGGPYAGIPDAYPWLFHSLAALAAQVLPGGVLAGFLAVQVVALLAVAAGGAGWLWQRSSAVVTGLRYGFAPYHGDFVLPKAMSTGMGNLPRSFPARWRWR